MIATNNWFVWNLPKNRIVRENLSEEDAERIAGRLNDLAGDAFYIPDHDGEHND